MIETLYLTSPLTRGPQVLTAQKLLRGEGSKFGNYHPGPVDGVWGQQAHAATKRAKYWLGYKDKNINGKFDKDVRWLLMGKRSLSVGQRWRRRQRLDAHKAIRLRQKAFQKAVSQVGVKESPRGSNQQKYGVWYTWNGVPWCAIFVSWCYAQAGSKQVKKGARWAYTPFMLSDAKYGRYGLRAISPSEAKQGDIVLFDWNPSGGATADHVGFFDRWGTGHKFEKFHTIEGNTAIGNDSNGGEVMRRVRDIRQVAGFVRLEA